MDSYKIFFKSVAENPEEERDTITKMTIALWNHTDGRETKHFLNHWFDELLETDSRYALAFLAGLQIKYGKSWVEMCIRDRRKSLNQVFNASPEQRLNTKRTNVLKTYCDLMSAPV